MEEMINLQFTKGELQILLANFGNLSVSDTMKQFEEDEEAYGLGKNRKRMNADEIDELRDNMYSQLYHAARKAEVIGNNFDFFMDYNEGGK